MQIRQLQRRREEIQTAVHGLRFRCGDYRVFFDKEDEKTVNITEVCNRRGAHQSGEWSQTSSFLTCKCPK